MSTEIPIWVNGEIRWLSGIDKKTTCKDIVQVLLEGEGIDKSEVKDFTIMERWRKVERPLDENSKILKVRMNFHFFYVCQMHKCHIRVEKSPSGTIS